MTQELALNNIRSWCLKDDLRQITTGKPQPDKISPKKRIAATVIGDYIDQEHFRTYTTAYIGSGYDGAFPIACGARNVLLLDPMLKEKRTMRRLVEWYIEGTEDNIAGGPLDEHIFKLEFGCYFRKNHEQVSVTVDRRAYPQGDKEMNWPDYLLPVEELTEFPKLALLIAFNSGPTRLDAHPAILDSLIPGGLIFADHKDEFKAQVVSGMLEKITSAATPFRNMPYTFLRKR